MTITEKQRLARLHDSQGRAGAAALVAGLWFAFYTVAIVAAIKAPLFANVVDVASRH